MSDEAQFREPWQIERPAKRNLVLAIHPIRPLELERKIIVGCDAGKVLILILADEFGIGIRHLHIASFYTVDRTRKPLHQPRLPTLVEPAPNRAKHVERTEGAVPTAGTGCVDSERRNTRERTRVDRA